MTTNTYRILQLALSKHLETEREHLAFVKKHPYSQTAVPFWEKDVKETEQAIEDIKEIYEAGAGFAKWN
jgi:hypothetical protein